MDAGVLPLCRGVADEGQDTFRGAEAPMLREIKIVLTIGEMVVEERREEWMK
jgi:hypothetical protein